MDSNNKEDLFYKVVNEAKQMKLTERERNSLFSAVDVFVERNPIKKNIPVPEPVKAQPIKSPFFKQDWFFAFSQRSHNYYIAGALLILAIFGTGTSFAAQNSLPGDVLYPVKVNILEEVKAIFLPSTLKPEYEIERAQTRIKEAKKLAEQNRLSEDVRLAVAAQIDTHISTVKKDITDLKQKGDIKHVLAISNSLESALDESQDQIEDIDQANTAAQVAFVKDIIEDTKEDAVKDREVIEDQIYTQKTNDENTQEIAKAKFEVTEKALRSIEQKLAKVEKIKPQAKEIPVEAPDDAGVDANQAVTLQTTAIPTAVTTGTVNLKITALTTEETAPSIDELVAQANDLLKQGQEKMDAQEYNEAFGLFREAGYITQIIEFRLGQTEDISTELDSVLEDINVADTGKDIQTKDNVTANLDSKSSAQ